MHDQAPMHGLDPIFFPRKIVLLDGIGRTGSVADNTWKNISAVFAREQAVRIDVTAGDVKQHIAAQANNIDLAIIVAPRESLCRLIAACDGVGMRGAVLLSADRWEPGHGYLPNYISQLCGMCERGMRLLGPQSFGIISPHHELNATPGYPMPRPGKIAFLSQSSALCSAVLDWSFRTGVGFSAMVSCDVMSDIDWNDLITYFGDDPHTRSIVIYLETIGEARGFLSAAREVALNKPIIVLKSGRTATGAAVAALHTHNDGGADAALGTDAVLNAALQRVGVLRVRSISEMFYMANILAAQPLPRGPRLTVVTNSVGPAVMATDTLLASGGSLARLASETTDTIAKLVQHPSCCGNPVDVPGDADAEKYASILQAVVKDKESDGTLVILTPQPRTQPTQTARQIVSKIALSNKPLLASWMGGERVAEGQNVLNEAGIPTFPYPDTPARLFALMWRHAQNLNGIYETPSVIMDETRTPVDSKTAATMLEGVRAMGRTDLTEWEAKAVLKAYGVPVVNAIPAQNAEEAIAAADICGFPVMLKLLSHDLSLKQQVNGMRINVRNEKDILEGFESIRQSVEVAGAAAKFGGVTVQKMLFTHGYELITGSRTDPKFGPYMYFGTGGRMTEIIQDQALGLPPLTSALAVRMMERTRVWNVLRDVSTPNGAARLSQLQALLVRISQLIVQHPDIESLTINPLLATAESVIAFDVRITVHPAGVDNVDLPRPAIRPYPAHYTWQEKARSGIDVLVRPVRPEDEPLIVEFHKKLSEETIYRRYFFQHKLSRRTSHERLRRTCFLDFDREIALAAVIDHPEDGQCVAGVGRLARNRSGESAELAIVVADPYQSLGIGTFILKHLVDIARTEGLNRVDGTMLPGNIHMQHLFGKLGFNIAPATDDTVVARLELS